MYYFVNEACRLRNKAVVPLLGPFAAAIAIILNGRAEGERPDKIGVGYNLEDNSPLGVMSGAFLLFRGSLMPPHAIAKFALMQGRPLFHQTKTENGIEFGKDLCGGDKATWERLTPEMKRLAGFVCLPGAQSTSVSWKVALEFAMPSKDTQGHVPTLFVICCQNYYGTRGFKGFRMDSALHSAHPYE